MMYGLFNRVVLSTNMPQYGLKKGDMGIVVEHVARDGQEDGYIIEFFDAQGNTVDVIPMLESDLEAPRPNTILTYRDRQQAA